VIILEYFLNLDYRTTYFIVANDNEESQTMLDVFAALLENENLEHRLKDHLFLDRADPNIEVTIETKIAGFCQDNYVSICTVINLIKGIDLLKVFYPIYNRMQNDLVWDMQRLMTVSLFVSQSDVYAIGSENLALDYVYSPYFQGLYSYTSDYLVNEVAAGVGADISVSAALEVGYTMLQAWKWAARDLKLDANGKFDPIVTRMRQYGVTHLTPSGEVTLESINYADRDFYLGLVSVTGEIVVTAQMSLNAETEAMVEQAGVVTSMNFVGAQTETNTSQASITVIVVIWALANMALITFFAVYFGINQRRPAIQSTGMSFIGGSASGLFLLSIAGILFTLTPSNSICGLRIWFLSMGYLLVLTFLIAKTYITHNTFMANSPSKTRGKHYVTDPIRVAVYGMAPFFFSGFVYTALWTLIDPSLYKALKNEAESVQYVKDVYDPYCEVSNTALPLALAGVFVVAVMNCWYAFSARRASRRYREAEYVFLADTFILVFSVIIVPVNFISNDINYLASIRGFGSEIAVTLLVTMLYVHKFRRMDLKAQSDNDYDAMGNKIEAKASKSPRQGR